MNRIKLSDIKWLLVLLCLPFVSSCKDDLEAYEEAEITSVGAYHRYYTTAVSYTHLDVYKRQPYE